jgi:ATP-dependent Lon protease
LEHLLLALIDDADTSIVLRGCNADLDALRSNLLGYLDSELKDGILPNGVSAKPSPAFERVLWGAALHARELGRAAVTGANVLMAIFPETRSPAARLLGQHGVSRERVAELSARDDPANETG